ncbi:MAG: hypothetical protein LBS96_07030, partial [Oscillospiraceae bacterium]|nr:hypothetical protein [Oscillospiraceae bacterium]
MKNRKHILSLLVTGAMLLTLMPAQFSFATAQSIASAVSTLLGGVTAQAAEPQAAEYPEADVIAVRRPVPEVQLRVPEVVRVAGSVASPYDLASTATGGVIVKATPSGVPETPGGLASTAYAGETPVTPTITLQLNKRAADAAFTAEFTSIEVAVQGNVTGGRNVTTTLVSKDLATGSASWAVGGINVLAGSSIEYLFTVKYKWLNPWVHIWVEDTYTFRGYSYAENVIYPAGVWAFPSVNNKSGATATGKADVRVVTRILGRNTYGSSLGSGYGGDVDHGYANFAAAGQNNTSDSFAERTSTNLVKVNTTNGDIRSTMMIWDPSAINFWWSTVTTYNGLAVGNIENGALGAFNAGGTTVDGNRPKAIVYLDPSTENLSTLGLRMSIFNNALGRGPSQHGGKTLYYRGTFVKPGAVTWDKGITTDAAAAGELGISTAYVTESARDKAGADGATRYNHGVATGASFNNGYINYHSGTNANSTASEGTAYSGIRTVMNASPVMNYVNASAHIFNPLLFNGSGEAEKANMDAQVLRGEYNYPINGNVNTNKTYTLV